MPRIPYFPDTTCTDLEIRLTLVQSRCGANRLTITHLEDDSYRAVWWLRDGPRGVQISELVGTLAEVRAAVEDDSDEAKLDG